MSIEDLRKEVATRGYLVWIDIQGKWHTSELRGRGAYGDGMRYADWLLSKDKQPWQREPEIFATQTWLIPAPKRHQALKIAKQDYKYHLLNSPEIIKDGLAEAEWYQQFQDNKKTPAWGYDIIAPCRRGASLSKFLFQSVYYSGRNTT